MNTPQYLMSPFDVREARRRKKASRAFWIFVSVFALIECAIGALIIWK